MSPRAALGACLLCGVLGFGSGCASPDPTAEPSGFLGDYSEFRPHPSDEGALIWIRPDLDLAPYRRVIIDPVAVRIAPHADREDVDPRDLARLALYFHTALEVAVRDRYPVIQEPAADALRLRTAITDVMPTEAALNTLSQIVPGRPISAAKAAITGSDLFVGQVQIEAEITDSRSGERLLALVDRAAGGRFELQDGASTWGQVEKAFREWALRFRALLDDARR